MSSPVPHDAPPRSARAPEPAPGRTDRRHGPSAPLARTIRGVALFEATKGTLVFLAGFGALSLLHRDVQQIAATLLSHFHLNPAKHYPSIFLDAAGKLTDVRLWTLAILAALYGVVRFVEAYGLWRERRWAEWLAAGSGAIYVPFEVYELLRSCSWLSVAALTINLLIVGVMVDALRRERMRTG